MCKRLAIVLAILVLATPCITVSGESLPPLGIAKAKPSIPQSIVDDMFNATVLPFPGAPYEPPLPASSKSSDGTIDPMVQQLNDALRRLSEPSKVAVSGPRLPLFERRSDEPQITATEEWEKKDAFFRGMGQGFILRSSLFHATDEPVPLPARDDDCPLPY